MFTTARSTRPGLFTKHRNATFITNSVLPHQMKRQLLNVRYDSWSRKEVAKLGLDAMVAVLKNTEKNSLPDAAVFSRFATPHSQALMKLCRSLWIVTIFHLDDLRQPLQAEVGQECAATDSETYMAKLQEWIHTSDDVLASTPSLPAHLAERFPRLSIRTVLGIRYTPAHAWKVQGTHSRRGRLKHRRPIVGAQTTRENG